MHGSLQGFSRVDETHNAADVAEIVNLALDVQRPADSHSLLLWRALQQYEQVQAHHAAVRLIRIAIYKVAA